VVSGLKYFSNKCRRNRRGNQDCKIQRNIGYTRKQDEGNNKKASKHHSTICAGHHYADKQKKKYNTICVGHHYADKQKKKYNTICVGHHYADKQKKKYNTICVGHHYTQTNTNNVN
jgi:hypothetical protein